MRESSLLKWYVCIAITADIIGFYYVGVSMILPLLLYLCVRRDRIPSRSMYVLTPLIILICIGLVGCLHNEPANVLKDLIIFVRMPLALLSGFLYCMTGRNPIQKLQSVTVVPSVVYSLQELSYFILDPSLLTQPAAAIRTVAGNGDIFMVIALVLLAIGTTSATKAPVAKIKRRAFGILIAIASILSFSRTLLFSAAVLWLPLIKRRYMRRIMIVGIPCLFAGAIYAMSSSHSAVSMDDGTFAEKIARAGSEVVISDYDNEGDINLNWRGYESFMALQHYLSGNWNNYLFGYGFGEMVDVGLFMKLGDDDLRSVPYFHNGYLYLLIKTGAVGMLLYLWFLWRVFRSIQLKKNSWPKGHPVRNIAELTQAVVVVSIFTTYIVTGFFNKTDGLPLAFFVGSVLAIVSGSLIRDAR